MEKIQFIWSGETELPVGWVLQPHCHDFFHLAYVRTGQLIFCADKLDYPLTEGSAILLPPGVVHTVPEDTHRIYGRPYKRRRQPVSKILYRIFGSETLPHPRVSPVYAGIGGGSTGDGSVVSSPKKRN